MTDIDSEKLLKQLNLNLEVLKKRHAICHRQFECHKEEVSRPSWFGKFDILLKDIIEEAKIEEQIATLNYIIKLIESGEFNR